MPELLVTCVLGSPFDVRHFVVRESLSQLFTVDILALSEDPDVDLQAMVGKPASFRMASGYKHAEIGHRTFSGICNHAERVQSLQFGAGDSRAASTYSLSLVPSLWLLTQKTNHRIFQHVSIPDIIERLLGEWGIKPIWQIERGTYPPLEYKTQYGETDYNFFARLLEEAGIAYTLADPTGGTALVLNDQLNVKPVRTHPPLPFEDRPTESAEREYATDLHLSHDVRPGARQLVDYDFRRPRFRLNASAPIAEQAFEQYSYQPGALLVEGMEASGETPVADDKGVARYDVEYGRRRARHGLEGMRLAKRRVTFDTNVVELSPGVAVNMTFPPKIGFRTEDFASPLLILSTSTNGTHDGQWNICVTSQFCSEPYRPPQTTSKPCVYGVQSASVVGPAAEEIYADEFGRVRVQFPWDREGAYNDDSSCWMRVSQGWGGVHYGMINLPRIGQEVLVSFLSGDTDSPIIVGRMFNALEPVPYKLPENKTVSAWKTCSSPATGGYNEIKLEDKAQLEFIYMRAERDMHKLVQRDETKRIERNHHRTILRQQHLRGEETKREHLLAEDHLQVQGDRVERVAKSTWLTVGADQMKNVGRDDGLEVGRHFHVRAGDTCLIEAGARLSIVAPGGFIDINEDGIDIVGKVVNINCGGAPAQGCGEEADEQQAQAELKELKTRLEEREQQLETMKEERKQLDKQPAEAKPPETEMKLEKVKALLEQEARLEDETTELKERINAIQERKYKCERHAGPRQPFIAEEALPKDHSVE